MYIDKLDEIVNKYHNTCHSTIKIKPVDVKSSTYIDFNKKNNKEYPKFEIGDLVKISKYINILLKDIFQIFMRLAQTNLATKANIADLVKENDFDNKLKKSNKKFTSNKQNI